MGAPVHRARVVPCGVDTAMFRPGNGAEAAAEGSSTARGARLLVVGRLVPRKVATRSSGLSPRSRTELAIAGAPTSAASRTTRRPSACSRSLARQVSPTASACSGDRPRGHAPALPLGGCRPLDSVVRALRDHAARGGGGWPAARRACCRWAARLRHRRADRATGRAGGPERAGRSGSRAAGRPRHSGPDGRRGPTSCPPAF